MKTTKIFLLALTAFSLVACDKHDFIDDLVITGEVGPQAYWEVASALTPAGSNMEFTAQYYTSLKDQGVGIKRSEVWYNITETIDKSVSCPWLKTFSYSVNDINIAEKRAQQKISEYLHDEVAVYSDSLKAYTFTSTFPISGTLSPFQWAKPVTFTKEDSLSVENYFGAGFMQSFKDSIQTKMKYEDYRNMFLGLGVREDFKEWTDSVFDLNTNSYIYFFKGNADPDGELIPADVTRLYNDSIDFGMLIQNAAENSYDVSYKRTYAIRAILRVYDTREVYGTTVAKDIEIN